eukprot:c14885_g1_i3 orf=3-152(-)
MNLLMYICESDQLQICIVRALRARSVYVFSNNLISKVFKLVLTYPFCKNI